MPYGTKSTDEENERSRNHLCRTGCGKPCRAAGYECDECFDQRMKAVERQGFI